MVIEELAVHNFGVFRGEQRAVLTPPSKGRPVVLFGGLNGAGKTTLLEAMQLVLYGRARANGSRGELGYDEYVRRLIHRHVNPKEGAAVEVVLRVNENGESVRIRVRRTWSTSGVKVSEKLDVFRDGVPDQHLADTWLDYVGRLIPPQLSELFFFDGERIESLADPTQSLDMLRSAVHALLGVDLVKQLQADLIVLNRRKLIERHSGPDKAKLEQSDQLVQSLRAKSQDMKQGRAQIQRDFDYAGKRLTELNEQFAREGGLLAEDRTAIERRHAELEQEVSRLEQELCTAAAGSLPLAMLTSMLLEIQKQAGEELDARQAALGRSLAEKRDARLVHSLRGELSDARIVERIAAILKDDREVHLKPHNCDSYLKLDDESRRHLEMLCARDLAAEVRGATATVQAVERAQRLLDDADRKLASIPDAEAISRLLAEREAARERRQELETQLKRVDTELASVAYQLVVQEGELQKLTDEARQADIGNEESDRFVRHSDRARETLDLFRIALTEKHASRLSANILRAFSQLLRKRRLIHTLAIDPVTCRMTLGDAEGNELPSERLSAGERQLLAVSILWGLGQAAGRPLPVIVDTPLGRLDTKHRMHLVERYFPNASHQVILLSTDEEITGEYLEALRPKIGRLYRLVHDDMTQSTKIESGYFAEEAQC